MNQMEYFPCDCCGLMTREDGFYTNPLRKTEDVCQKCHDVALEIIAEDNKNECGCLSGCNYCLMLEY